jgi:hypothetical protein
MTSPSAPGRKLVKRGLICFLVGYLPLQLYILLGPADGNPIGLGLLFVVAAPAGAIMALIGAIQWVVSAAMERQ